MSGNTLATVSSKTKEVFFFSGDQRQEQEYHVQLVDGVNRTEVLISDENDVPVMEGDGLLLLQALYKTIKQEMKMNSDF